MHPRSYIHLLNYIDKDHISYECLRKGGGQCTYCSLACVGPFLHVVFVIRPELCKSCPSLIYKFVKVLVKDSCADIGILHSVQVLEVDESEALGVITI